MKWLILLVLFSCTSRQTGEVTPTTEEPIETSPTESNAKPVSPYSVEPCVCMKIYQPVCGADGLNYGNSCEAECHGNKTWTEGGCKK